MKTIKLAFLGTIASLFAIAGCQQNAHQDILTSQDQPAVSAGTSIEIASPVAGKGSPGTCNPNAYIVLLESRTAVSGGWEWVWSVQNSNPGNGSNGTVQNLSHWGMQFGPCFNISSMISAAYSGNGTTWTNFTPAYQPDPSQSCMTTPVLKFDFGTAGSAKSYYKLVVGIDYPAGPAPAYYKSGANTGCCTFTFNGIGCGGEDDGPR